MSRLSPLRKDQLDESGAALWDAITETRGAAVLDAAGGLAGPFNAWVHAVDVGSAMSRLGGVLRFGTSIDRRLVELAIITVGARWQSEFEWYAHARMAREFGVADDVVDAIGAGHVPPLVLDDERAVYSIAHQLVRDGRVDPDRYAAGVAVLGERGMVELVTLCGYYTLISFTLNAFEVGLPDGVDRQWSDSPGLQ